MTKKLFKIDLTLEIEPDIIEELFNVWAQQAEDYEAVLTQYRYYVPKNEQEGERN